MLQSLDLLRLWRPGTVSSVGQLIDADLSRGLPRPGRSGSGRFCRVFGLDGGQCIADEVNEEDRLALLGSLFEGPPLATVEDRNEHIIDQHVEALVSKSRNLMRIGDGGPRPAELVFGLHQVDWIPGVKGFQRRKVLKLLLVVWETSNDFFEGSVLICDASENIVCAPHSNAGIRAAAQGAVVEVPEGLQRHGEEMTSLIIDH